MNHSATNNQYKCRNSNSNWRLPNIAFMVGGFMLFPPVGFAVLAWLVIGKNVDILGSIKSKFNSGAPSMKQKFKSRHHYSHTGNSAFDSYKHDSISRLEEEMQRRKEQLKEEETAFNNFVISLQKSKDQAEFDQFMQAQKAAAKAATEMRTSDDSE
ncbi:MAG: DUF2852 domain-containing protein [Alphaproteobacteria bacterium]|nr:DUF2852 domain-containing protein [Alphaproteobacteria bacterium]